MKVARLRERIRRQEQRNRQLAATQDAIVEAGGRRLGALEAAMARIEANSARLDALEAALAAHTADAGRHTGAP